jgi:hypothetical protein
MGRVLTNGMTLSYAREASLGVLPGSPQWFEIEPNSIGGFGTTIAKEVRTPINRARARRKGVPTDLDSATEIEADLTLTHMRDFAEAFCFARAVGGDAYLASAASSTVYTIPVLSSQQAARLIYGASTAKTLLHARGFVIPGNNGIKVLGAAVTAGGTTLTVSGLAAETVAAKQMAEVAIAGIRGAAGDLKIDAAGNLTSTGLDFTTTGITKGQVIHIGGVDVLNRFFNVNNFGFARVDIVAANKLTLSKRDQPFTTDDGTSTGSGGTPVAIDILFGQFVRNVAMDSVDYLEVATQFELASPNLMPAAATGFEYSIGNWADSWSIAIPLTGKVTTTMGFVGLDTTKPTATRATNAANAKAPNQAGAFSSATDIARLRVQDVDETGLTTDFKTVTFTLTNSVAGEKVIGKLGAKYLNAGDIQCDIESQQIFTNPDVIERIRCNRTVGFDWVLRNGDGGAAFDLPTGTLGGGAREYPANQSVLINDTFAAHQEEVPYGYTLGISFFPVLPSVACP